MTFNWVIPSKNVNVPEVTVPAPLATVAVSVTEAPVFTLEFDNARVVVVAASTGF